MSDRAFIQHQLIRIEQYLKQEELWSDKAPEEAALMSETPFAADAMPFEQWLQFIYLPKMQQYLEQNHGVPARMQVAPMAHEVFAPKHLALTHLLMALDNLSETENG
ncbi:YqcC family protein [Salinimonas sp. HHU 13199]|uniref:YqcC family protein n=1 Tax=Salinimonas profundi TaxID=2729140 RepID=A0ABR8LJG6_9ALTE|nr:YqcC family protein [Salinimonas profundi]MBD3585403.1 YqcC family protein [Salinimonas profundi]